MFFGTATLCNQCGITPSANTTTSTTAESASSKTPDETTEESASETATIETAKETTTESSQDIELVDMSKLVAVFAIANDPGDKLITFYSDADEARLKSINGAIGEDGKFYTIEYDKKQDSNDQDSGKVVSDNFDNMEGYIYIVTGQNLVPNNTYYLCSSEVISKDNPLTTVSTGIEVLDQETRTQIKDIRVRSVQEGWIIDKYSDGTQILIAVFEPQGNNFLMSIILKTSDSLKFMDYPAVSDGQSVWRVDDGGKINPELFSILFSSPTNEGMLLVICWAGAEGETTILLIENIDSLSQLPLEIYRYWSPG